MDDASGATSMKTLLLAATLLTPALPVHAGTLTLPPFTVGGATGGGTPGTCPDDDGSAGSTGGAPNYPTLISAGNYKASINGAKGLGCKVPGVDYYVGVPQGLALKDPTTAPPAGCKYDGRQFLNCTNATINGFDFALHHTQLTGSGNIVVTNSKFEFGANCADPVINVKGNLTLRHSTIDGTAGWNCSLNQGFGTFVVAAPSGGGFFIAEWNHFPKIDQDGLDINPVGSGNMAVTIRYNAVFLEGHSGHPDFIQYCGTGAGVMTPNVITHNMWYGNPANSNAGVQPLHVEAQICTGPGHIKDTTVAFNVVLGTGACKGGQNWPANCSINFAIACKLDDPTSSNDGFKAYGNYIDISGGIAALTSGGSQKCPGTSWGTPFANYDMPAGIPLGTNPQ